MQKKVIVGLTGRSASCVAAFLLKKQGFSVIGVTIQTNNSSEFKSLENAPKCHIADTDKIKKFCDSIKIPLHVVDGKAQFKADVVDSFLGKKMSGLANTSCFDCNQLKIKILHEKMIALDADFIATGHYAKIQENLSSGEYSVHSNSNPKCDQSYLLSGVDSELLKHLILPLGEIGETEVLKIGENFNLAAKPEKKKISFCFDKIEAYQQKAKDSIPKSLIKIGEAVNIDTDSIYGKHEGFYQYKATESQLHFEYYTAPLTTKYEVVGFEKENSRLLIGEKKHLTSTAVLLSELKVNRGLDKTKPFNCYMKSKSFEEFIKCVASFKNNNNLLLEFEKEVYPLIHGERIVIFDTATKNSRILGTGTLQNRGALNLVDRALEYRSSEESEQLKPIYLKF